MPDLLSEIRERLQRDYGLKGTQSGKHLRKGECPSCRHKSLWTFAETPWVVRCERLNNCGFEAHAKELYADLFESWTERFQKPEDAKPEGQRNPTAAADAYLQHGRGFNLALVKGLYTQESFYDPRADHGRGAGTATVRFAVADTWWERLIDQPQRFGKQKARFKQGGSYAGHWWAMPSLSFADPGPNAGDEARPPAELWLVEGIFDAIALAHHGVTAVALLSCNNYPQHALAALDELLKRQGGTVKHPTLVWALDGDNAGRSYTRKHVQRAREAGWVCEAAQIPQTAKAKQDWNDLHQRGRLEEAHVKDYRYHGALLLAPTARDKALLIHERYGRAEFDVEHSNRLWWFELKEGAFNKSRDDIAKAVEKGDLGRESADKMLAEARASCISVRPIANCYPRCLYYQRNEITDEAWYYFRIAFPDDRPAIKGTFTAGQLTAAAEFEKRLLHMAPGAMWSGNAVQLKHIMAHQLEAPKEVQTVDFVGYSAQHQAYLLGKVAVRGGEVHEANAEDYFDFDRLSIKTLQKSIKLDISTARPEPTGWVQLLWQAFGAKGVVALSYWLGTLFAEQVRAAQQSLFFLEIVGEPGAGKTTLITFLWKLLGRDYEGFDPSKATSAGRLRTFTQVSNLPIVLIESDREGMGKAAPHVRSFDWDELKDAYNGNPIRTTGVKTGGNETYDPPFRASIVISQNNPVQASQAVMERICHLTFDTSGFTSESYEAAKALERLEIDQVSGFILAALKREAEIVKHITGAMDEHMRYLLSLDGIAKPRIAKNHAQLMAMAEATCRMLRVPAAWQDAVRAQIETMARERQAAISADPPVVAEFWEAFDYLDGLGLYDQQLGRTLDKPLLNHATDPELIAVNLNQFIQLASERRQQVPLIGVLKKELRHSKTRPFADIKSVASAIHKRITDGHEAPKTVHCWVFRRSPSRAR